MAKTNCFVKYFNDSPYVILPDALRVPDISENKLKEMCLQTVREGFYVERLSVAAREQFLEEETVRVNHKIYPGNINQDIKRLLVKLDRALGKHEKEVLKDVEGEIKYACAFLAPFSIQEVVGGVAQAASYLNAPSMFSHQPLTEWEQQQLVALLSGEFDMEDMVTFLEDRYQELSEMLDGYWAAVQQEASMLPGGLASSKLYELAPVIMALLETAHRYTTTLLNLLSRRLRRPEHRDYPYRKQSPMQLNVKLNEAFRKQDANLEKAMFPDHESLSLLKHRLVCAQGI
jgi:hypothetical protein